METIMIDTSAVYAMLDRSDQMHGKAKDYLLDLARKKRKVMLTNFIVAECHALISSRLNHQMARDWIKNLCWPVERVSEEDETRALQIILSHEDKSYSYTDAITFAVMERIGLSTTLAFDHYFAQYGFTLYTP